MKFRIRKRPDLAQDQSSFEPEQPAEVESGARPRWSTAFLIVGSALAGATALALLNRRTIASMRAQIQAQPGRRSAPSDEEIV